MLKTNINRLIRKDKIQSPTTNPAIRLVRGNYRPPFDEI